MEKKLNESEIKEELTKMLGTIDKFFKKNHILYSIDGGTLLGAVRHQGFIPWDDDIDICLHRPDYIKLLELLKKNNHIDEDLYGIGYELGNSDIPYLKVVNSRIHTRETISGKKNQFKEGNLWIDIFPIDSVPDKPRQSAYYFLLDKFVKKMWYIKWYAVNGWQVEHNGRTKLSDRFISVLLRPIKLETLSKFFIGYCSKESGNLHTEYVGNTVWGTYKSRKIPRNIVCELKEYKFQGLYVPGWKESDKWLSIVYGDYMKLPPESERYSHGLIAWEKL